MLPAAAGPGNAATGEREDDVVMSQPSAPPGVLSPEAVRLIDGQYADRPHLRPILDAVLAAIPSHERHQRRWPGAGDRCGPARVHGRGFRRWPPRGVDHDRRPGLDHA